jgi:hypothetical protein
MDAVTIGPIPRWTIEPLAPARSARQAANRSWFVGASPNTGIFVRAKYNIKIPRVQISLFLK